MENLLTILTSDKLVLAIAVLISIMILFSLIKKLVKIALVLLSIMVLYIGYLVYTGQKVPQTKHEIIMHSSEKIDSLKKIGTGTLDRPLKK